MGIGVIVMALVYVTQHSNRVLLILLGFLLLAATAEFFLQKMHKREVKPRIT